MGNPIQAYFGSSTGLTGTGNGSIGNTLASLANGSAVSTYQGSAGATSAITGPMQLRVYFNLMTGTTPTQGGMIVFYLLQWDTNASGLVTDGASANGGAFTPVFAPIIHTVAVTSVSNVAYKGSFVIKNPGPLWAIGIGNFTGSTLNGTAGNFSAYYVTESIST